MSDPNESWNQGRFGQPLAPGGDLNQWSQGDSVRKWNEDRLAEQNRVFTPQSDSFTPTMPNAGPMNFGGGGAVGGTGARVKAGAGFLLLLFVGAPMYLYSIPLWVALYPAAAFVSGIAALATFNSRGGPGLGYSGQIGLGLIVGFIVAWPATLADQALARFKPYWIIRHVGRLGCIFFWAVYSLTLREGHMVRISPMHRYAALFVWSPQHIGLALVAVVVMHFWLSGMPSVRSLWRRLRGSPSAPVGETVAER